MRLMIGFWLCALCLISRGQENVVFAYIDNIIKTNIIDSTLPDKLQSDTNFIARHYTQRSVWDTSQMLVTNKYLLKCIDHAILSPDTISIVFSNFGVKGDFLHNPTFYFGFKKNRLKEARQYFKRLDKYVSKVSLRKSKEVSNDGGILDRWYFPRDRDHINISLRKNISEGHREGHWIELYFSPADL